MADLAVSGSFSGSGTLTLTTHPSKGKRVTGSFSGSGTLDFNGTATVYSRAITSDFVGSVDLLLNDLHLLIERSQVWYDPTWLYRRVLYVQANDEGIEVGHPITCYIPRTIITQNKARSDLEDLQVLRLISYVPEQWEVVPHSAIIGDHSIEVQWDNRIDIDADVQLRDTYYIYYGNKDLGNDPELSEYVAEEWPVVLDPASPRMDFTRPGEHWIDGVATEYLGKATLTLDAEQVRIKADTGPTWGTAEVQIDNGVWEEVDLFSFQELEDQVVYTKTNLGLGVHTLRYRVSGMKNPSATDTKINFTHIEYLKNASAISILEEANETLMWGSAIGGVVGG